MLRSGDTVSLVRSVRLTSKHGQPDLSERPIRWGKTRRRTFTTWNIPRSEVKADGRPIAHGIVEVELAAAVYAAK